MINTKIKSVELQVADIINNSGLEIAVISLILDKLSKESNLLLQQVITIEQEQAKEDQKKLEQKELTVTEEELVK